MGTVSKIFVYFPEVLHADPSSSGPQQLDAAR